jgi:hypothetical protein
VEWVGQEGEMAQALYAHMNNKKIKTILQCVLSGSDTQMPFEGKQLN